MKYRGIKKSILVAVVTVSALVLGACGSGSSKAEEATAAEYYDGGSDYGSYASENYSYDNYPEEMVEEAYDGSSDASVDGDAVEGSANQNSQRMLIKTVSMTVETEDMDSMTKNIEKRVDSLGGYVESLNIDNAKYSSYERKTANVVARIPVEKLDAFVNTVEDETNVLSKNSNAEDVTLRYVDMQSRLDSYQTEYDRISALLEKADDLDTIIGLEARLTDLRYEIESYGSQLKVLKNQATYSTVNLSITQVVEYTPVVVEEQTRFDRLVEGFVSNCKSVGNGIVDFFISLIIALPILAVWAVVIGLVALIMRAIVKKCKKDVEAKKSSVREKTSKKNFGKNNKKLEATNTDNEAVKTEDSALNSTVANEDSQAASETNKENA